MIQVQPTVLSKMHRAATVWFPLRHPALHDSMKVDSKKVATKGGDEGLADEVGGVVGELEEVRIGRLFPIFRMLFMMTFASMRHLAAG